jgi:hypothetical protein
MTLKYLNTIINIIIDVIISKIVKRLLNTIMHVIEHSFNTFRSSPLLRCDGVQPGSNLPKFQRKAMPHTQGMSPEYVGSMYVPLIFYKLRPDYMARQRI